MFYVCVLDILNITLSMSHFFPLFLVAMCSVPCSVPCRVMLLYPSNTDPFTGGFQVMSLLDKVLSCFSYLDSKMYKIETSWQDSFDLQQCQTIIKTQQSHLQPNTNADDMNK
uniref:Uncharacterized protein n=1 Tax=Arion vulgaris TaxID=1028688 RepID=A0A0B6Y961_9EUPU